MNPGTWLVFFRRALCFLRPQRRRIMLAIAFSFALALSFAASLGAIVPIVRLLVAETGPRVALLKVAAQRTWSAEFRFAATAPQQGNLPTNALIIRSTDTGSPFAGLEGSALIPEGDTSAEAFMQTLSGSDTGLNVTVRHASDGALSVLQLSPPDLGLPHRALVWLARSGARWLPIDTSTAARRQTLLIVFSGVFAMVLVSAVCRYFAEYLIVVASNRAVMDMRRHMYHTVMYLPITWFGRHLSETMSRVVTDFKDVERGYRALFGKLMTEPIKILILLTLAVAVDWRITSFSLIAGIGGATIVWVLGRKIRKANRKLLAGYAQMMGVLNATLSGMRVVRAFNMQTFERRRMWQSERRLLHQLLRIGRWEAMTGPMLEVVGVGIVMLGVVWMADHVFSGRIKGEIFLLLVGFMVAIFDSLRKMSAVFPRLARADGAAQRVFELIDRPVEHHRQHDGVALSPPSRDIVFENITYQYPESERPALSDFSLHVTCGQRVALVGPNGSGKTTLMGLLLRFHDPSVGRILIDGHDLRDVSIRSLRHHIGVVTQDAVIFAGSVFDNIAYGRPRSERAAVVEAATRAEAHDFIEQLPRGYDTILGEFGATLSGGQRQRLALARAIFLNSPVFVFDEATSQVDAESERKINLATRRYMAGRTSFVIAHRIATIADADLIAVLDDGRLVDSGQHDALLERCELYRTLFQSFVMP